MLRIKHTRVCLSRARVQLRRFVSLALTAGERDRANAEQPRIDISRTVASPHEFAKHTRGTPLRFFLFCFLSASRQPPRDFPRFLHTLGFFACIEGKISWIVFLWLKGERRIRSSRSVLWRNFRRARSKFFGQENFDFFFFSFFVKLVHFCDLSITHGSNVTRVRCLWLWEGGGDRWRL